MAFMPLRFTGTALWCSDLRRLEAAAVGSPMRFTEGELSGETEALRLEDIEVVLIDRREGG